MTRAATPARTASPAPEAGSIQTPTARAERSIREEIRMRKVLATFAVAIAIAIAPLTAALSHEGHSHAAVVEGTVTKVDAAAGTVTIKHAAIPNLQMEAMTMEFKASDPAMLKDLKEGDEINFTADNVNGALTVTDIDKR
jgi:Cu(I)/Ag(I) efflux system protein CusF